MREYLLYITTDLTNGYVYAGCHHGTRQDKYIGSGSSRFLKEVKAKGYTSFKRIWLRVSYKSLEQMKRAEIKLIRRIKKLYGERCYNVHTGGSGGDVLLYAPEERKKLRDQHISEGKKRQYEQGFTELQKTYHARHGQQIKNYIKNNLQTVLERQRRKGTVLSNRIKTKGLTWAEVERNKSFTAKNPFTLTITEPGKPIIVDLLTFSDTKRKYNLDEQTLFPAMKSGVYIIKRRTSMTKHNFQTGTQLSIQY